MNDRSPPRTTIAYVATAHLCLLVAAGVLAAHPDAVTFSLFDPRTLVVVHLITLGWLSATALGSVYLVLPAMLRVDLRCGGMDVAACIAVVAGISGVVSHLWLATYSGVAWSGFMVAAGFAWIGIRAAAAVFRARLPRQQQIAIGGAFVGAVTTAAFGVLVAHNRSAALFAAGQLRAVAAHSHIGFIGWLGLLVVGIAHRLLPMFLPASIVVGRRASWTVGLLCLGTAALPAAWLLDPASHRWQAVAAAPVLAGVALFALDVRAMLRQRKPRAKGLPRPDPAMLLALTAVGSFVLAAALGAALLTFDLPAGCVPAYGVLLLLGGFGTLVLGIGQRLWPLLAWLRAFHRLDDPTRQQPPSPGALAPLRLQWSLAIVWLGSVAALASGVGLGASALVRIGGVALFVAGLLATVALVSVLRRARTVRVIEP